MPGCRHRFDPIVEDALNEIESFLTGVAEEQKRFYAIKLFERDEKIVELISKVPDVESIIKTVEEKMDDDAESIITNERYQYISSMIKHCYHKKRCV